MRSGLHLAAVLLCLASAAQAQRAADLAPAEPVPTDFAGTEWRDSRGCVYVRATVAGAVSWLPVLDAERRLVCTEPGLADLPEVAEPAPTQTADAPEAEAADPDVPPQIAEAGEVLARVARIATGQGARQPEAEIPAPRPPAIAAAPEPEEDPFAALGRMAEDTGGPTGRLIFVPPDDRVRIVQVVMPSVLVGDGDPFGVDQPRQASIRHAPPAATQVGYHPPQGRLRAAPPIRGFGPDPAPLPRVRRAALPERASMEGADPTPLVPNWLQVPALD